MTAVPRVVIAAPSSGHGKTAVAVGLLAALRARGLKTAGFKVGPDHVDAAYLGLAAGRPGRNLDPRLVRHRGEVVAGAVDLDRVLALPRSAPRLVAEVWRPPGTAAPGTRPVIAVAGSARCAYGYAEAAELLTAAGAEVAMVDPLRDETLPGNTSALVVGGGLPEAYLDELAANVALATRVRQFALTGRPIVAEGIGLAWLAREFDGRPMCGVLDVVGRTGEHPVVGYREATVGTAGPHLSPGTEVVGYKQHRGLV